MYLGPFDVEISTQAEQLDFTSLSEEEKEVLSSGITFNPSTHDVFRFFICPKIQTFTSPPSRKIKDKSYQVVDQVRVRTKLGSTQIRLLGIHPCTTYSSGQMSFDFEGEALFEVNLLFLKLKLRGEVKSMLRKKHHSILASRVNDTAEWVFTDHRIKDDPNLPLCYLCVVPRQLNAIDRFIECDVSYLKGNRRIKSVNRKLISIPLFT